MKYLKITTICLMTIILWSCVGDKKSIIGADLSEDSFVNKNFKGNLINYDENMSACGNISEAGVLQLYDSSNKIMIRDSSTDDRLQTIYPTCKLTVMLDKGYLLGSLSLVPVLNKEENWVEDLALEKATSKSAEWVEDMGKAAMWKASTRKLSIRFEGYTLYVTVPGLSNSPDNKERNKNQKAKAIALAKMAGYIK